MVPAALFLGAVLALQTRAIPPPPPPDYHPLPGPFSVRVDAAGVPTDPGVLDNAIARWRGPKLSAFLLCFQPGRDPSVSDAAFVPLRAVSEGLKARGAAVVVVDASRRCRSAPFTNLAGVAHVEILGVLRDQD